MVASVTANTASSGSSTGTFNVVVTDPCTVAVISALNVVSCSASRDTGTYTCAPYVSMTIDYPNCAIGYSFASSSGGSMNSTRYPATT